MCWPSTPPEWSSGWRAEMSHSVLREKLTRQVFKELHIFRSQFFEPNSYISPYLEKHQNPSWRRLFLMTCNSSTKLVETFRKNMCLIPCIASSPKSLIYYPSPLPLEQSLRAIWGAVFWDTVLILPQIKLSRAFFEVDSLFCHQKNKYIAIISKSSFLRQTFSM